MDCPEGYLEMECCDCVCRYVCSSSDSSEPYTGIEETK